MLGLGNADFLWVYGYDSEEILKRMRWAEPSYTLRGGYTYQNIMYLAAGVLLEKVSGIPWGDFLSPKNIRTFGNESYISLSEGREKTIEYFHSP